MYGDIAGKIVDIEQEFFRDLQNYVSKGGRIITKLD